METDNFKLLTMVEELTKKNFKYREENKRLRQEKEQLKFQLKNFCCDDVLNNRQVENVRPPKLSRGFTACWDNGTQYPASPEKVSLFVSLFRGRDDVYAYRWVNKAGRSRYSPAIKGGYFSSRKTDNKNLEYLPLTTSVIEGHLNGKQVIGVYPMLSDETCWFLAADFDKADFEKDALMFQRMCLDCGIPAYIERSRSCNGAHVWIFFDEPVPAAMARKFGFSILTKTMNRRHQIELSSYDRFFPNQDTLPRGGFGNLIALPLQKLVRAKGGSVFVDASFQSHVDQWQFLSSIERVTFEQVKTIVHQAETDGAIVDIALSQSDAEVEDPWTLPPSRRGVKPLEGPFPESVRIVQSNQLFIEKKGLSSQFLTRLKRIAAFQNPEFFKHQAMRLSVYNKPRVISCSEDFGKFFALPRGCLEEVEALFKSCGITANVEDERLDGSELDIQFNGSLRDLQEKAVKTFLKHDTGVLSASTAFGKTVVAANLIAKRRRNTLVLVHRRQLMDQWRERLALFLGMPIKSIGLVGGGRKRPSGNIDIAMIQSLVKKGEVSDLVAEYGHIIVDECHHVSAFSFESVLKEAKARYILGLTATPKRKDGHHPIVVMQCGPIRYRVSDKEQAKVRSFDHVVIERKTGFTMPFSEEHHKINDIYASLVDSTDRSKLIVNDIVSAVEEGRSPLLLTERTAHLEYFQNQLAKLPYNTITLRGGMGKKQRKTAAEEIVNSSGSKRIILATGRYIGEGFDDDKLDTLFLAMPISWTGTLQQYVGRLHRMYDQKKVVQVYDYVDHAVPTLQRMFQRRVKGYRSIGYRLIDLGQESLFGN